MHDSIKSHKITFWKEYNNTHQFCQNHIESNAYGKGPLLLGNKDICQNLYCNQDWMCVHTQNNKQKLIGTRDEKTKYCLNNFLRNKLF